MKKLSAFAIACAVLLSSSNARAEWTNATVRSQANVHRQANDSSEVLGHLREGKAIRIYRPERNGFYAVNFGRPIKGTTTGWIATADVQVQGGDEPAAAPQSTARRKSSGAGAKDRMKASYLDLGFELVMAAPSNFQTTIQEDTKGVNGTQFGLTYGHRIRGSSLGWLLGAFYYTVKGTGATNGGSYQAKGFGGQAGLDYQFLNSSGGLAINMQGTIGVSINSAGNTTTAVEYNTSNILAFPIRVELDLRKYFGGFGFVLGGGYQIASLKEVPVVLPQAGNPESVADFALSGIYGRIGLSLNFE